MYVCTLYNVCDTEYIIVRVFMCMIAYVSCSVPYLWLDSYVYVLHARLQTVHNVRCIVGTQISTSIFSVVYLPIDAQWVVISKPG